MTTYKIWLKLVHAIPNLPIYKSFWKFAYIRSFIQIGSHVSNFAYIRNLITICSLDSKYVYIKYLIKICWRVSKNAYTKNLIDIGSHVLEYRLPTYKITWFKICLLENWVKSVHVIQSMPTYKIWLQSVHPFGL